MIFFFFLAQTCSSKLILHFKDMMVQYIAM